MPSVFFVSPVVDIASCHRLRTYRGRKGMLQCTILDVALASISTLGLFGHAEIGTGRRKYTSAGMNHTNPIKDVLDEAEQIFGKDKRVACIVSLGAGVSLQMVMPSNLAYLEVHGLLQAMEMQQKMVTEEVGRRFGTLEAYYRFSVPGIGSGCLSDWTNWDVDIVKHHAEEYLDNPRYLSELDAAAEQLSSGRGTITLDGLSKLKSLDPFSSIFCSCPMIDNASGTAVTAKSVPPTTQLFVLRKKSWTFIEQNLAGAPMDKQNMFVLSGMGGCGKSTLLSYYVQTYGSR
jgi:hypothetical protein